MIFISTRQLNGNVEMIVKDNGAGIPEEIKSRIFKIGATHGKVKGTGIGLYSAKMIVELHGGKISFKSEAGKGTEFKIVIPLQPKIQEDVKA